MSYVHTGIETSVLYPSVDVGVCVRIVLVPSLGFILVCVVGTYILAKSRLIELCVLLMLSPCSLSSVVVLKYVLFSFCCSVDIL